MGLCFLLVFRSKPFAVHLFHNPVVPAVTPLTDVELRRFVAILFFDAVQRMWRVTAESDLARSGQTGNVGDVRTETNLAARKF